MGLRRSTVTPAKPTEQVAATSDAPAQPSYPAPVAKLGEILVRHERVTQDELANTLLQQSATGKRIGALLVEVGALKESDLAEALAEQYQLELVDLGHTTPQPEALALIPETIAREACAMPFELSDTGLKVAVADPSNEVFQLLRAKAQRPVTMLVATESDVRRAIDGSYRALSTVAEHVRAFSATELTRRVAANEATAQEANRDDAPVVRIVNLIIAQGLRDRASDIHVEPKDEEVRVRYRIDGALHDVLQLPADMGPALASRIKIMANMNIVERRRPQDGQIQTAVDGRQLDIRVSTTPVISGEKTVMRLLDKSKPLFKAHDLGMPEDTNKTYTELVQSPFGMVICAGPTGSGKTTTLYATMAELDSVERNIMTIEDPVEYVFPTINQIQINEQAGVTFADGLRSILRQDPDIILVGEIRDVETARIAVQSALTGHFVLSSIHATDAVLALHRFLDMGIESFLVASSVRAVVGQRLLRRICTSCKERYEPGEEELALYAEMVEGGTKTEFYRGAGCNFCAGTGYRERIGIYELLRITPEIKRLIVGWATQDELRRLATQQGMRTLKDEAMALVDQDITTIEEVMRSVYAV